MTDIIRVNGHPNDPEILLLHTPQSISDLMGRYEPARYDPELKSYLLHIDQLASFEHFASYAGIYLVDERAKTNRQIALSKLCDICNKPESVCQKAAGNSGQWHDHGFTPVAVADSKRAEEARHRRELSS